LINNPTDLKILREEFWYRVPEKKLTPSLIKDKSLEYIAFYLGAKFKENGKQVKYYAKVNSIELVQRFELFPDEVYNVNSNNYYYKIGIVELKELSTPILSKKPRFVLFIKSNLNNFLQAKEINDLFVESPIEEKLWKEFKNNMIVAERQLYTKLRGKVFYIDFAIFCNKTKLAVECDGDTYHTDKQDVKNDKIRDNILRSGGWTVMRYHTDKIMYSTESVISEVKETINYYGGLEEGEQKYFPKNNEGQSGLFDSEE